MMTLLQKTSSQIQKGQLSSSIHSRITAITDDMKFNEKLKAHISKIIRHSTVPAVFVSHCLLAWLYSASIHKDLLMSLLPI